MSGTLRIACCCVVLALGACRQTLVFDRSGDGGVPNDNFCSAGTRRFVQPNLRFPEIVVALDRSFQMNEPFGATLGVNAALAALDDAVLKYQTWVRFGFVDFPGVTSSCTDGCCAGQVTPLFTDYQQFSFYAHRCDAPMLNCIPADQARERPISQTLFSIRDSYRQRPTGNTSGSRYVLLVTDGEPTCVSMDDCTRAVTSLRDLNPQVRTIVVVLGNSYNPCLSAIALNGGSENSNPYYYPASSPELLAMTVMDRVESVATEVCRLELQFQEPVNDPDDVALYFGNFQIPRGGPDGWDFDDRNRSRVTLRGEACQGLLEGPPAALQVYRCDQGPG